MGPSSESNRQAAEDTVLAATGRSSIDEALLWIAEDHPLELGGSWSQLLRAVVGVQKDTEASRKALRRLTKEATNSEFDTSRILFNPDSVVRPAEFRKALEALIRHSPDQTFGGLNPIAVLRAQTECELSIEALCLCAGVSHTDAITWFNAGSTEWSRNSVSALLGYLDELVAGVCTSPVPGSVPSRGIEFDQSDGWETTQKLFSEGVPLEVLLAQRAGGGVWLAHKNKTSSFPNIAIARLAAQMLQEVGIPYLLSNQLGGSTRQSDLQELSRVRDKRVSLVIHRANQPVLLVCFSSAKDSGTARANGDGLLQIPATDIPFAAVLTGLGWSGRTETDRLARRFAGLLFTEKNLGDLVEVAQDLAR